MITISEKAAKKIVEYVEASPAGARGLRIRVVGGGCSGLTYKIDLDVEREGDEVFERAGARVYVDRKSLLYLDGTVIDYRDGMQNAGFSVSNPNARRTCGCGESFVV
ncbi:MAG: iron-sulfur cluster assembly accessory protein [Candidatus Dadabacteria bacterium]|nr:MAG: iron-sulfur cluster assembly accessory protein [Candidatus Dadabacteria bacterium]